MILLYDGVCGLCNDWVQFTLKRDRSARIRFAPLQGPTAERILRRHGRDPRDLDTVYLVRHPDLPDETLLTKSSAILGVLDALGGGWKILALARILPRSLRDFGYDFVARRRYRWFGRKESCPIPTPEQRARFLD